MPPAFITALLLTMALGGVTTAALPYIFWRTPQTRFALVVALLVAFTLLTLALLGAKSAACALLLLLYCLGTRPLIARALTLTAAYYFTFSFLPWMSLLLLCSAG